MSDRDDMKVEVYDKIHVSYHLQPLTEEGYYLGEDGSEYDTTNGLFDKCGERSTVLRTGIHTGWIELAVRLQNRKPDEVDPN